MSRSRAAWTLALVVVSVPLLAAPSAGREPVPTWDQVRAGLAHHTTGHGTPTGDVTLSVPDLSAAIDDRSAPPALRRAACHQVTGLDDESTPALSACLRQVGAGTAQR